MTGLTYFVINSTFAWTGLISISPTWCRQRQNEEIRLLDRRITNIVQTRNQQPQLGDLPLTSYRATLDDGSEIYVGQAFHTDCTHIVPYGDSELWLRLHPSYFEAIQEIFNTRNSGAR